MAETLKRLADDEDGEEIAKNVSLISFEGTHQRHMQYVPSAQGQNMVKPEQTR